MTKPNYTHIAVVLDRSGSMESVRTDTIGGFNTFLKKQQEVPGEGTITLVQFDDNYEVNYSFKPLKDAAPLTEATYQPRGWTALYDAVGKTIVTTGQTLAAMPESARPSKVVFVILTDGHENASREYNAEQLKKMIKTQTDEFSWDFVFLGANQDAILSASFIGISAASAVTYNPTGAGTVSAFMNTADAVTRGRVTGASVTYSSAERSLIMDTK